MKRLTSIKSKKIQQLLLISGLVLLIFLGGLGFSGCRKADNGKQANSENRNSDRPAMTNPRRGGTTSTLSRMNIVYPVEAMVVQLQNLVYTVNAVGSVEAFEKVQVTARVPGVVEKVLFAEGDHVQVNQVLAEIEPERYQLAVEAAEAAYQKALASKADAEAGLNRREMVSKETPGLIPAEEIETWRTKLRLAEADVAQAKAALDQANLNLHDAYVRAPFSGVIQTRTVETGQYIQVGAVLASLIRRDPLLLRFKVPEKDAARIKVGMPANFRVRDVDKEFTSTIIHVAASTEEASRMVEIVARIKDTGDEALRPGAFAEISVPVSTPRPAPVIPQTAIRPSERGFLAYVIENDKAVERIVRIGMRTSDGRVEVLSGINPGETVVVRGGEALRNGVNVKVVSNLQKAMPEAPEASGQKSPTNETEGSDSKKPASKDKS